MLRRTRSTAMPVLRAVWAAWICKVLRRKRVAALSALERSARGGCEGTRAAAAGLPARQLRPFVARQRGAAGKSRTRPPNPRNTLDPASRRGLFFRARVGFWGNVWGASIARGHTMTPFKSARPPGRSAATLFALCLTAASAASLVLVAAGSPAALAADSETADGTSSTAELDWARDAL